MRGEREREKKEIHEFSNEWEREREKSCEFVIAKVQTVRDCY
jgi:archaellum biogenesis protein FlaJ (TadC family)